MKRTTLSLLSLGAVLSLQVMPVAAVNINRNVNSQVVANVQAETFDERKQLTQQALTAIEDILAEAEEKLTNAEYASAATVEDGQAAIDLAQEGLDELQADVDSATNTEALVKARQDAVAWAKENKDVAKEIMVDLYVDGLNASVAYNEKAINTAESLVAYFKKYQADTTTLESLIKQANGELPTAKTDVSAATAAETQDSLETATRSVAALTETVAKIGIEVEKLYEQIAE